MRIASSLLVCAVAGLGWSLSASTGLAAVGSCVHHPAPPGAVGKRVALIVGNGAYGGGIPALPNPTHDAEAISKAAGVLGFEVFLSTNADSASLQKCLDEAEAKLADTDVAMFYFSGHGIQIKDENYLVAIDAAAGDLKRGFVPVQPIVDKLQKGAKATLVLLDACRTNPMAASTGHAGLSVSTGRGLSRAKTAPAKTAPAKTAPATGNGPVAGTPGTVQARGLMVAYATSPNAVAQDGSGALSPFTAAFIKTVGTSGYSIQRVMSDVTKSVGEETGWTQTPWMKSSLTDELKLGGGQTLADARSLSDNHAARAKKLLDTDGKREAAVVEALKGLPASSDEAALKRFPKAYLALYTAVQSRDVSLPIGQGHAQVAVSTQDRVAVFKQNRDIMSGSLELWSASERKLVATPAAKDAWKLMFSPHGKLLATQAGSGLVALFDGRDGTKLFDLRAGGFLTSIDISPDESRLLLVGNGFVVIDVATHKPVLSVKAGALAAGGGRRSGTIAQAMFAGDDKVCFILNSGISKGSVGVFDLKEKKTTHIRDVDNTVTVLACDPAGKHMIRTFAVNTSQQGMEIWDLNTDAVTMVKGPIFNILGIDPKGGYASVLAFSNEAEGLYDLATGKKGHPPAVPDGYKVNGSRVHNAEGAMVNQDLNPNAWRDWPDETLFGPALVTKAMAGLTPAQREEVARERITYVDVAGGP